MRLDKSETTSRSKLFDTLMVFLEDFFFKKDVNCSYDKKSLQNTHDVNRRGLLKDMNDKAQNGMHASKYQF